MEVDGDSNNLPDEIAPWSDVLDFVDRLAVLLGLSGCSLGILAGDAIHTYNRGFADDTSRQYAVLPVEADLPGPATLRMRRNQFFATRADAHRRHPEAADIDGGTQHDAAATLVLANDEPQPIGYLALHFASPRSFDEAERQQLERLAASVTASLPRPRRTGATHRHTPGPRGRSGPLSHRHPPADPAAVARAMRVQADGSTTV